ncbi:MAG TPA: DNA alkylation repair protein [Bacteroidia bacterium]
MEPLKEMFNLSFYKRFAEEIGKVDKNFHPAKFVKDVTANFEELSLNQRMRNTSVQLHRHLPHSYKKQIEICRKVIPNAPRGYVSLVFPDFVGLYGKEDFDTSLDALKYFTSFGSSEFAIREFLKLDFKRTIKVMEKWADDKDHHVRRLASEGSRARLPWSFKLEEVIKNPKSTLVILEKLKCDEELYVKKSVANHLNDLSKDNPGTMLSIVKAWDKGNAHTAWIVKHASRSLIKKGNADSLSVFDFEKNVRVKLDQLKLNKAKLKLGETLAFGFDLISEKKTPQKLVVDYVIHYMKKGGELSPKVFKLKELNLQPGKTEHISKQQMLKDFTTRKHYAGKHIVEVMVNGKVMAQKEFILATN